MLFLIVFEKNMALMMVQKANYLLAVLNFVDVINIL
jgi:hypothetical protein